MVTSMTRIQGQDGTGAGGIALLEPRAPMVTTLLQLVQTIQDHADSDEEVVAVVSYLLNSGRVMLGGNFAGAHIDISAEAQAS